MRRKHEEYKRATIYVPLVLLDKLHESSKVNRRSFNQEVMWRLEKSYAASEKQNSALNDANI
jgi:hypothetical protein